MFTSFNARALGPKLPADETLRLAHLAGFDGVDIMVRDALDEGCDPAELRRTMDDLGLRAGAFPFPFNWRGPRAAFEDDLRSLPRFAKAAAQLGLTRTGTWVLPETPEGWTHDSCFEFHAVRLAAIVHALGEFGITLGLEVIGVESSRMGKTEPFIHRLDGLPPLHQAIEAMADRRAGVLVDSWHLYAAGEPLSHALAFETREMTWIHVADLPAGSETERAAMIDSVRGLPGEHGAVESHELLRALRDRGYDGPVTAEPLPACRSLNGLSNEAIARAAARSLRSIWPE